MVLSRHEEQRLHTESQQQLCFDQSSLQMGSAAWNRAEHTDSHASLSLLGFVSIHHNHYLDMLLVVLPFSLPY